MPSDSIHFFNRYTGEVEQEDVYGEGYLRWAYCKPLGRLATKLLFSRLIMSRFYGALMNRSRSRKMVGPFIEKYGLDVAEFEKSTEDFTSFNDFFVRKLKPETRPVVANADAVVFPADGRHFGFQNISETTQIFAKGQRFDLRALLGSREDAERYLGGALVLSRLCPVDYHRFHFPCDGTPSNSVIINGPLLSVNPIALRRNISILFENKRSITFLDTARFGRVVLIEVGATCVGSICQTYVPGKSITRSEEKGYFAFGGSSTITLFEPGKVQLADDLTTQTAAGLELYAKVGDIMGEAAE